MNLRPSDWTAIIPAAGKGSRLEFALPKILYPILDKPMLLWLIHLLDPLCQNFVFVVSPQGKLKIQEILSQHISKKRVTLILQESPRGTADAVLKTRGHVHTPQCLVIWGDQIGILPQTIKRCMQAHIRHSHTTLTFPTLIKKDPYVHFIRDIHGKITGVQQTRRQKLENTLQGENDFGLFLFNTQNLFNVLEQEQKKIYLEAQQEFDLLQTIPTFERQKQKVLTLRVGSEEETLGINSLAEAQKMERILKNRRNNRLFKKVQMLGARGARLPAYLSGTSKERRRG